MARIWLFAHSSSSGDFLRCVGFAHQLWREESLGDSPLVVGETPRPGYFLESARIAPDCLVFVSSSEFARETGACVAHPLYFDRTSFLDICHHVPRDWHTEIWPARRAADKTEETKKKYGAMMKTKIVGSPLTRVDAWSKTTGEALYAGDLSMPGMLHMKILFARRPHAIIKDIDTRYM
jgi:hypothetical protein